MTKLLKPEVFGARLDPPRTGKRIKELCRAGRIKDAVRPGHEWLVPENARVEGAGIRIEYGENTGISMREYAELHGVSKPRVWKLAHQGRFGDSAKKGPHGWDFDPDAPWPGDDF